MKEPRNFFDDLQSGIDFEKTKKQQQEARAKGAKVDWLIHRTFQQNEAGQELLKLWKEALIMNPTADFGMGSLDVGINEGMKRFIRGILLTIQRVERGE